MNRDGRPLTVCCSTITVLLATICFLVSCDPASPWTCAARFSVHKDVPWTSFQITSQPCLKFNGRPCYIGAAAFVVDDSTICSYNYVSDIASYNDTLLIGEMYYPEGSTRTVVTMKSDGSCAGNMEFLSGITWTSFIFVLGALVACCTTFCCGVYGNSKTYVEICLDQCIQCLQ